MVEGTANIFSTLGSVPSSMENVIHGRVRSYATSAVFSHSETVTPVRPPHGTAPSFVANRRMDDERMPLPVWSTLCLTLVEPELAFRGHEQCSPCTPGHKTRTPKNLAFRVYFELKTLSTNVGGNFRDEW